jgi:hypothetical protein
MNAKLRAAIGVSIPLQRVWGDERKRRVGAMVDLHCTPDFWSGVVAAGMVRIPHGE